MTTFRALKATVKLSLVLAVSLVSALAFAVTPAIAELKLERFAVSARNENGTPDVQAGSHPYALTTTFLLNTTHNEEPGARNLKDVRLELPPGFVGDPTATPRCSYQALCAAANTASRRARPKRRSVSRPPT